MNDPQNTLESSENPNIELVGTGKPEKLEPATHGEVHDSLTAFHDKLHHDAEKVVDNPFFQMVPVLGPFCKAQLENDTAMTALTRGVNIDTGEKYKTMKERMDATASHIGKSWWESGKAGLDAALWAVGIGEVGALAKAAKGVDAVSKVGKFAKVKNAATTAFKGWEMTAHGIKGAEMTTMAPEAVKVLNNLHKVKVGGEVAIMSKNIIDGMRSVKQMTPSPETADLVDQSGKTMETVLSNPDTQKAFMDSYHGSPAQQEIDAIAVSVESNPEAQKKFLEDLMAHHDQMQKNLEQMPSSHGPPLPTAV